MITRLQSIDRNLFTRRCVACGYDGALLRGGTAPRCARCGCDLLERPARSYAEMEGLIGQPITIDRPRPEHPRPERILHRWLVFLFMALMCIIAIGYLSMAALPA
jgi:hypothetical protein